MARVALFRVFDDHRNGAISGGQQFQQFLSGVDAAGRGDHGLNFIGCGFPGKYIRGDDVNFYIIIFDCLMQGCYFITRAMGDRVMGGDALDRRFAWGADIKGAVLCDVSMIK